jgi:hypothetical protein
MKKMLLQMTSGFLQLESTLDMLFKEKYWISLDNEVNVKKIRIQAFPLWLISNFDFLKLKSHNK